MSPIGTAYLFHFDRPYKHARHYLGWTESFDRRAIAHSSGNGARLLAVVSAAGIEYELVRIWPNVTRAEERRLKRRGGSTKHCPHPECKAARARQRRLYYVKAQRRNNGRFN